MLEGVYFYVKRKGIGHASIMDGVPAKILSKEGMYQLCFSRFVKHLDAINDIA